MLSGEDHISVMREEREDRTEGGGLAGPGWPWLGS